MTPCSPDGAFPPEGCEGASEDARRGALKPPRLLRRLPFPDGLWGAEAMASCPAGEVVASIAVACAEVALAVTGCEAGADPASSAGGTRVAGDCAGTDVVAAAPWSAPAVVSGTGKTNALAEPWSDSSAFSAILLFDSGIDDAGGTTTAALALSRSCMGPVWAPAGPWLVPGSAAAARLEPETAARPLMTPAASGMG